MPTHFLLRKSDNVIDLMSKNRIACKNITCVCSIGEVELHVHKPYRYMATNNIEYCISVSMQRPEMYKLISSFYLRVQHKIHVAKL